MATKNSHEENAEEAAAATMMLSEEAARRDNNVTEEEEEEAGDDAELEEADECRICRSSAVELLEAEAAAGGCCCGCYQRKPRQPPLRRLRCACTGSVRHVCDRCYGRYYVARGLTACEICRQPTGLEGLGDGDVNGCFCRRLATFACASEARLLVYGLFIVTAVVSIFVLFFVAADSTDDAAAASASGTPKPQLRPEPQRRLERTIFVAIASLNLGVALAYIGYSYWRHCHGGRCCGRRLGRAQGRGNNGVPHQQPQQQQQQQQAATSIAIEAITVTILQQPPLLSAAEVEA